MASRGRHSRPSLRQRAGRGAARLVYWALVPAAWCFIWAARVAK